MTRKRKKRALVKQYESYKPSVHSGPHRPKRKRRHSRRDVHEKPKRRPKKKQYPRVEKLSQMVKQKAQKNSLNYKKLGLLFLFALFEILITTTI